MLHSSEPFISRDLFILYSDVVLIDSHDQKMVENLFKKAITDKIGQNIIIFIKVELLDMYIPYLLALDSKFILITTCCDDYCMPYYFFPPGDDVKISHDSLISSRNLIHWFTQNPSIKHSKLTAIPIGPKWQYSSRSFFGEDKVNIINILYEYGLDDALKNFKSKKSELIYVNFSQTTYDPKFRTHRGMRENTFDICKKNKFPISNPQSFENYLANLKLHKFCISPPGMGIDTHRAWESLMCGTIPIMFATPMDNIFEDLPVVIIDDWSIINEDFLNKKYEEIKSREYNFEKLYSPYWKNKIQMI